MLSGGEIGKRYSQDFLIVGTDPVHRNRHEELRSLPKHRYIPNFVFLDATGKVVLETRGFGNPREAKAIHEFVARKHYLTMSLKEFLASYPEG